MTRLPILGKLAPLKTQYDALRRAGTDPYAVTFDSVLSAAEAVFGGRRMILLGTNNYLGLTFDESCVEAAIAATRATGTGTTGSRVANGTYAGHAELERRLADFFGRRSAMVFTTGYQANLGILSTIAGRDDHIIIDADSHASIYDGCRLGSAQVIRFKHNNPEDLARRLDRLEGQPGSRLIVVEGIYSMHGDFAPLREIAAVKRDYGAYLMVDEAHSLGVLGRNGRGLAEHEGLEVEADFLVGTFSKSLGAIGGFCVSDLEDFDILRVACRPYMFTASLPPSVVASVTMALSVLESQHGLRTRLMANANRYHAGLSAAGFELGAPPSPIVAIRMPDVETAVGFWNALLDSGVYMNLALPPATPGRYPLLRSSVSTAHTPQQLDQAVEIMVEIGSALGLLTPRRSARSG